MSGFRITRETGLFRAMARLALPNLGEEFLMLIVGWTDWYLAGHYVGGDASKAAMGQVGYLLWLVPILFASISVGTLALVARHIGAGDRVGAERVARQGLLLGLGWAGLVSLAFWFCSAWLVRALQLEEEAALLADRYLAIVIPVIPLIMLEKIGGACLHGSGDTVTGMLARVVIVFVNLVASYSLVTGSWGLPNLGWAGLAWGTALGHLTGAGLITAVLLFRRGGLWHLSGSWQWDRDLSRRILRIGLPAGFDLLTLVGCQLVFLGMVNSLGTAAAAAHSLAIQLEACVYLPGQAFQVAAAAMTGQLLGAGEPARARSAVWVCLAVGSAVVCSAGLLIFFQGRALGEFFAGRDAAATVDQAARLLQIVAIAAPFMAGLMILGGALRGAGDTRWPFAITLVGLLLVRLPLTALFSFATVLPGWTGLEVAGFGWGVEGAWYAMVADLGLRCGLIAIRFLRGRWMHQTV